MNIVGGPNLTLFEVNEAAEIVHSVAHPDANIIFGSVVDETIGDAVRVTVIAAGFERWEGATGTKPATTNATAATPTTDAPSAPAADIFGGFDTSDDFSFDAGDDDLPSFLR